jgi:hypothetical protein
VAEDTGGVPKMVGKTSNGRDPKIPEAATRCGGAITALSGRHRLTAAVVVKGEGGERSSDDVPHAHLPPPTAADVVATTHSTDGTTGAIHG